MDTVEVSTSVYLPPEEVYAFLLDFPGYGHYSEHLQEVRRYGDGDPGTEYELDFAWWKLSYTARSRVTNTEPPHRIDWSVVKDIDAVGHWFVRPLEDPDPSEVPAGEPPADAPADPPVTQVTFRVEYAAESAREGTFDLPRFVSLDWVIEKLKPKVETEAERIVRRIVADLEGQRREVDLEIETR